MAGAGTVWRRFPRGLIPPALLRLAYSAPVQLLDARATFTLELSDGSVLELPAPTPWRRVSDRDPAAGSAEITELERRLQAERERRVAAEARALDFEQAREKLAHRVGELTRSASELTKQLEEQSRQAAEQVAGVRAELEEAEIRAATLAEVVRGEPERRAALEQELAARMTGVVEELGAASAARVDAEDTANRLATELEGVVAELATVGAARTAAEVALTLVRLELTGLHEELEAARTGREQAEVDAARRAKQRARALRHPQAKPRAAEPPHSIEKTDLAGAEQREAALAQSGSARVASAGRPAEARPRQRWSRRRLEIRWRPSEAMLGTFLLVLGLIVALLILTGEVKLGFAP